LKFNYVQLKLVSDRIAPILGVFAGKSGDKSAAPTEPEAEPEAAESGAGACRASPARGPGRRTGHRVRVRMLDGPALMAEFSAWANERLYSACATLSESELAAERGAFFGSILGTLNHILLVNILYRERLESDGRSQFKRLDDILHTDVGALREAQRAEDAWYVDRVSSASEAELDDETVGFYTLLDDPEYWEVSQRLYFSNLFQHQIHHRGQVHNMLSQAGLDPPPIGYIEYHVELATHVKRTPPAGSGARL